MVLYGPVSNCSTLGFSSSPGQVVKQYVVGSVRQKELTQFKTVVINPCSPYAYEGR